VPPANSVAFGREPLAPVDFPSLWQLEVESTKQLGINSVKSRIDRSDSEKQRETEEPY